MYNKNATLSIPTKRYSFKKGWLQVPSGQTKKAREELMQVLQITSRFYFSTILNRGIRNIGLDLKEEIDNFFNQYGITQVWDVYKN